VTALVGLVLFLLGSSLWKRKASQAPTTTQR
jgi:hypothetical protein